MSIGGKKKVQAMRVFRFILIGLISLLVLLWCGGWLIGQRFILNGLNQNGLDIPLGDEGGRLSVDGYRISGFPFHYRLSPTNAQVMGAQGLPSLSLDNKFAIQVSLLGSAISLLSGGEIGARLYVPGTYQIGDNTSIKLTSGWIKTSLSGLSLRNQETWIFDGVDLDFRDLSISSLGKERQIFETLTLDMQRQESAPGYEFAIDLTGLTTGIPDLDTVPDTIDRIALSGRIQPDIRGAYIEFAKEAANSNPLTAMFRYGDLIQSLLSSSPGIYLSEGTLKWGEAYISTQLDLPITFTPLKMAITLDVKGAVEFQNVGTFLETLLKEPSVQEHQELTLILAGLRAIAPGLDLDLNSGLPNTFEGPLMTSSGGFQLTPEQILINGHPLQSLIRH